MTSFPQLSCSFQVHDHIFRGQQIILRDPCLHGDHFEFRFRPADHHLVDAGVEIGGGHGAERGVVGRGVERVGGREALARMDAKAAKAA